MRGNKANLSYWNNKTGRLVGVGDTVTATTSKFNLTEGKEYIVKEVYGESEISIVNDVEVKEIYTVEWFK